MTTFKNLMASVLAVAVFGFLAAAASGAFAADKGAAIGGDCCSDLEARIAELEATTARKGNRKMSLKVYGQVTESVTWYDIQPSVGTGLAHYQVQSGANRAADTYLGTAGEARITKDTVAGFVLELGMGNYEQGLANPQANGNDTNGVATRQAYVYVKNGNLGGLSIGLQNSATWDVTGITGQGVDNLASTNVAETKLSIRGLTGPGFAEFLDLWDGVRNDSIKYNSPEWNGFSLSASWGDANDANAASFEKSAQGQIWDVALRWNKDLGEFHTMAALGYRDGTAIQGIPNFGGLAVQDVKVYSGSAGVQHMPTGLFANGSYGNLDLTSLFVGSGAKDITAWEVQAGDELHLNGLGHTTLFFSYGQFDLTHLVGASDKPTVFGFGVVQAIDPAAMSLFFDWKRYQDEKVIVGGDVDVVMGGARVKF